jgi:hypothetical protein
MILMENTATKSPDSPFPAVMPHGDLDEVFPNVFFVTGTVRPTFMDTPWQFSRNMTVVREGTSLTLINAVRLDDVGLKALDALGTVDHVVKIGFHGMDDAFYVDRYGAKLWALPGVRHEGGLSTDLELAAGGPTPFSDCGVFVWETATTPEALLIIERNGGIAIACDSLQNWIGPDRFFDDASTARMKEMGFFAKANVGPGFLMESKPERSDFEAIEKLRFSHLLSGHGEPLRDTARADVSATVSRILAGA